jgi:hypothetical protein
MKFAIQVDLESSEISELAASILSRTALRTFGELGETLTPDMIQSWLRGLVDIVGRGRGPRMQGAGLGPVPGTGPVPWARGPAARPVASDGVVVKCFRIDESRGLEAGWCCCKCATYNALERSACRHCSHPCCGDLPRPEPKPNGEQVPR